MYTYVFTGCGWFAPPQAKFLKKSPVFVRRIPLSFQIEGKVHIKTVLLPTSCIFTFISFCFTIFMYALTIFNM